jgi:hypothetical protein
MNDDNALTGIDPLEQVVQDRIAEKQREAVAVNKAVTGNNPDQFAKHLDISTRLGIPVGVVEEAPDDAAGIIRDKEVSDFFPSYKAGGEFISNPDNLRLVNDDLEFLRKTESIWTDLGAAKNLPKSIGQIGTDATQALGVLSSNTLQDTQKVFDQIDRTTYATRGEPVGDIRILEDGTAVISDDTLGLRFMGVDPQDVLTYQRDPSSRQSLRDKYAEMGDVRRNPIYQAGVRGGRWIEEVLPTTQAQNESLLGQGSSALGSAIGYVGIAALLGPEAATAVGVAQSSGQQYQDAIAEGASQDVAKDAALYGMAPGLLEALPAEALLGKFGSKLIARLIGKTGERIVLGMATEGAEEALQQVSSNLIAQALYAPDRSTYEGLMSAAGGGSFAGGVLGAIFGMLDRHAQGHHKRVQSALQMNDLVGASKLMARSPEKAAEFIGKVTGEGADAKVYIPAQVLQELFQSGDGGAIEVATTAEQWGLRADQLTEALAAGADVEMSVAQFMTKVSPSKLGAQLKDRVRFGENGMSVEEFKRYEASRERMLSELTQQVEQTKSELDPLREIFDDVYAQARLAGRSLTEARNFAALYTAWTETRAGRLGGAATATDLHAQNGLGIRLLLPESMQNLTDQELTEVITQAKADKAAPGVAKTPTQPAEKPVQEPQENGGDDSAAEPGASPEPASAAGEAPAAPTSLGAAARDLKKILTGLGVDVKTAPEEAIRAALAKHVAKGIADTGRSFEQSRKREVPEEVDAEATLERSFQRAGEGAFRKNRELKAAMQEAVRTAAKAAKVDLTAQTPENIRFLARLGVKDALYALTSNANAVGWYDTTVTKAMNTLALIHPELNTDPQARFAFIWALAVTSNGMKVDKNFELAELAYRAFKATGKMPTNLEAGQAQKAINDGLSKFNELIERFGPDDLQQFMVSPFTVAQLARLGMKVTGENSDTTVRGAAILGPKIGNGFFSNLYGYFDQLTMDRWLMRTWGRWTGNLIEERPDMVRKKRAELKDAVAALKADKPAAKQAEELLGQKLSGSMDELAMALRKMSQDKAKRTKLAATPAGDLVRKTANSLAGYLDGQIEQPENGDQRNYIRAAFGEILRQLQEDHGLANLTMSDLQALLWYPEKRLYDAAKSDEDAAEGYDDDEAPDYANAAAKLARANGVSEDQLQGLGGDQPGAGGAERGAGEAAGADDVGRGGEGFDPAGQRQFLAGAVIRATRSHRLGDEAAPGPYSTGSRGDGAGVRVGDLTARAVHSPNKTFANAIGEYGGKAPKFYEFGAEAAPAFRAAISASKAEGKFGAAVFVYEAEDYSQMRLFLTDDLGAGFALKGQDVVSVFVRDAQRGSVDAIMSLAVQQGGRTLDCFDTVLPDIYARAGFKIASRMKWNDQFAPPGWDKATFARFNGGEPDVTFMAYDASYYASPLAEDGIYFDDYDKAVEHQLSQISEAEAEAPVWAKKQAELAKTDRTKKAEAKAKAKAKTFNQSFAGTSLEQLQQQLDEMIATPNEGTATEKMKRLNDQTALETELFRRRQMVSGYDQSARGKISFSQSGSLISLFADADHSTLVHEMGHMWLERLGDDATSPGAPQQLQDDYDTILKWLGSDGSITVDQHEQFARGVERYLMEGNAPSVGLQRVFDDFKRWLIAIYRTVAGLNSPINDDVRRVMDRLLASNEEIEAARSSTGLRQLFTEATADTMTKQEFEAYKAKILAADAQANGALLDKVMADIRIRRGKQWIEDNERVTSEVAAEIDSLRAIAATRFLRTGKSPAGDDLKPVKLDRQALIDMYHAETFKVDEILKLVPNGIYANENGVHPDLVAPLFDYASGRDMIDDMISMQQQANELAATGEKRTLRQKMIDDEVESRMQQNYGTQLDEDAIREEATRAIHNGPQADVLAQELRILARKSKGNPTPLQVAQDWARQQIDSRAVGDVTRLHRYAREEARAGKEAERALLAGKFDEAYAAKRKQLLNHLLYSEAAKATDQVDKAVKYLDRLASLRTSKSIDQEYLEQIHGILDRFSFEAHSQKKVGQLVSLREWMAQQNDVGIPVDIPENIANEARRVHYTKMTVADLRDLRETIGQIEHLGKLKARLIGEQKGRLFAEHVGDLVQSITDHVPAHGRAIGSWRERNLSWLRSFVLDHRKLESLMIEFDGGKRGTWWKLIYKRLSDASDREVTMRRDAAKQLKDLFSVYSRKERRSMSQSVTVPELSRQMTRWDMISLALNTGNSGNLEALLDGSGYSVDAIWGVLNNRLTKKDMDFVQSVWDYIDTFWPQIAELEKTFNGIAPEKIDPLPVATRHGIYKGGYYPLKADPKLNPRSYAQDEGERFKQLMGGGVISAATRRGHTKERVGFGKEKPVSLDINVLFRHVDQVIHDLTHRAAVVDAHRLLNAPHTFAAVNTALGHEAHQLLDGTIRSIAAGTPEPTNAFMRAVEKLRSGYVISRLGLNLVNMLQNTTGILPATAIIGEKHMMLSALPFLANPVKMPATVRWIGEQSTMMRDRIASSSRDMRDVVNGMDPRKELQQNVKKWVMMPSAFTDYLVASATWLAGYNKSMAGEAEGAANDHEAAVQYADSVVRQTQGAGYEKDLVKMQRGNAFMKLLTTFLGYFVNIANMNMDQMQGLRRGRINPMRFALNMLWINLIPAVLGNMIVQGGPPEDDDRDAWDWVKWAAWGNVQWMASGFVGVRDITNAVGGWAPTDAYHSVLDAVSDVANSVSSGKWGRTATKQTLSLAGTIFSLPTGQIWKTGDGITRLLDGEDLSLYEALVAPPPKRH